VCTELEPFLRGCEAHTIDVLSLERSPETVFAMKPAFGDQSAWRFFHAWRRGLKANVELAPGDSSGGKPVVTVQEAVH
jgi:hypothetical protein